MRDRSSGIHRWLVLVVGILAAGTAVGLIVLWPSTSGLESTDEPPEALVGGAVRDVERLPDDPVGEAPAPDTGAEPTSPDAGSSRRPSAARLLVEVEVLEGPDAGELVPIELSPEAYPDFEVGDRVELSRATGGDQGQRYFVSDFQRTPTLAWLAGLFVVAVLVVGRWHGLRSLLGLAASLLIVVRFVVPGILSGASPPLIALVGALAVMLLTLYLAHGVNEKTTAAVIGTAGALGLTVALGLVAIELGKITGFSSEDATLARFAVDGLDLQGLVLAGLIIAALGVLDDVTVSQASTVFALHDADRHQPWATLFTRAMRVGRDHIASVVNTLFLAYAGASLALLVLFSTGGLEVTEIINSEVFAAELIKIVVGSLGLIAAVPLTTALASTLVLRRPTEDPPPLARPGAGEPPDHDLDDLDALDLDEDERARRAWSRYLRQSSRARRPSESSRARRPSESSRARRPSDGPAAGGGSGPR